MCINMNLSESAESLIVHKVGLIIPPVLMSFGIPGNILSIIILFRLRKCQQSTYLVCLAVADLVVLCGSVFVEWLINLLEIHTGTYGTFCKVQAFVYYSSLYVSSWMLVLVTTERLCSVIYPHKVRILFSPFRALLSVIIMVMSILGLNAHFLTRFENFDAENNCWRREKSDFFSVVIWPWMDVAVGFIIPCALLILGNSLIVYKLRRQRKYGFSATTQKTGVGARVYRVSVVTKRVVVVNLVYLTCMLPVCVTGTLFMYKWPLNDSLYMYNNGVVQLVTVVLSMVMLVNNSVNFFLYILIGFKFRQELFQMMSGCKRCQKGTNN